MLPASHVVCFIGVDGCGVMMVGRRKAIGVEQDRIPTGRDLKGVADTCDAAIQRLPIALTKWMEIDGAAHRVV